MQQVYHCWDVSHLGSRIRQITALQRCHTTVYSCLCQGAESWEQIGGFIRSTLSPNCHFYNDPVTLSSGRSGYGKWMYGCLACSADKYEEGNKAFFAPFGLLTNGSHVCILSFSSDYKKTFQFQKTTRVFHPPWLGLQTLWAYRFNILTQEEMLK